MPFNLVTLMSFVGGLLLLATVLPIFPFLYVVLRWRTGQKTAGVGTHGALLYFATVGFLLALGGGANLVYGIVSITPVDEEARRLSWAFLTSGTLITAFNMFLMQKLGPLEQPDEAVRVFLGFMMLVTGMVATGALVAFFAAAFQKAEGERATELKNDQMIMFAVWFAFFVFTYLIVARVLARHALEMNRRAA